MATIAGILKLEMQYMSDIKKVVLAYSGGLDTSVMLNWLKKKNHFQVVTFSLTLWLGQGLWPARSKLKPLGIK